MHPDYVRQCLQSQDEARPVLASFGLRDLERGWRNLAGLGRALPFDGLHSLCGALARLLPRCPDPDMALNNLERFLANPEGARQLPVLLEHRARTLETLLQLFSTSYF